MNLVDYYASGIVCPFFKHNCTCQIGQVINEGIHVPSEKHIVYYCRNKYTECKIYTLHDSIEEDGTTHDKSEEEKNLPQED